MNEVQNAIELFIRKNCIVKSGLFITAKDLRDRCILSQAINKETLERIGIIRCRIFINKKQQRCFYGIGWNNV